ncbi:hypothetical protein Tco_1553027 [Tanacetum coccineum]
MLKTSGVKNMTTVGTRAVVNTGKGKMDNALKDSRWVWRPKGNYMDHESKEKGSFILKKFEYVDLKGISKSVVAWVPKRSWTSMNLRMDGSCVGSLFHIWSVSDTY